MNGPQVAWTCSFCGAANTGPQDQCLVCRNPRPESDRIPQDTAALLAALFSPGVTLINPQLGGFVGPDGSILKWPYDALQGIGGRVDTSTGKVQLSVAEPLGAGPAEPPSAGPSGSQVVERAVERAGGAIVFRAAAGRVVAVPGKDDPDSRFLAALATSYLDGEGRLNDLLARRGLAAVSVTAHSNGLIKFVTAPAHPQVLTPTQLPKIAAPQPAGEPPVPASPLPAPPTMPQPAPASPQPVAPVATDPQQPTPGEARFCPNCGQQRRPGGRFCVRCGTRFPG